VKAYDKFKSLSTTKKVLVIWAVTCIPPAIWSVHKSNERYSAQAAEYQQMTPEQQKALIKAQVCRMNPEQCKLVQDAEVRLHNIIKEKK
jgi:hypothetical protein